MQGIADSPDATLRVIATGMHLEPRFGETWREIEADGFAIDRTIRMSLDQDSPAAITRSMALELSGFADALEELQPDLMVVLGDRFELLVAVSAALIAGVPVAHLHGGEVTVGAIDESIRHAITKMSHLHFVAAEEYRRRVIQLGENPSRVFLVGGLGIDNIKRLRLLNREELESALDFRLGRRNLLVTFHPVTTEMGAAGSQMRELLFALGELADTRIIFTMPNADADNEPIFRVINEFVAKSANAKAFASLGQQKYLSCVSLVDGVVGNSSSGLAEVPTLKKGTINIGARQDGRLRATSIIDCAPERSSIADAIKTLYSPEFQERLSSVVNPYGEGGASEKVVEILRTFPLEGITRKPFFDIRFELYDRAPADFD